MESRLTSKEARAKAQELMELVGLRTDTCDRYPHMFSGGQRQRIGIARALSLKPKILICDEPVSALDISIQAQVINLFKDLQQEFGLTYIFISHDLSVVRHIADKVLVMYLGKIVELNTKKRLFDNPSHPYTKALLASTPVIHKDGPQIPKPIEGELPSPLNPPDGCSFHKRCPFVKDLCLHTAPALENKTQGLVACHYSEEISDI